MSEANNLPIGTKIQFLTGNDKNKTFTIKSELIPCTRTEGCYTAESDTGTTVYIFPSELGKQGYKIIQENHEEK